MRYRGPLGLVEAGQFIAGEDVDLVFYGKGSNPAWPQDAFSRGILERGALGQVPSLHVHWRGACYGIAKGDWVLRTEAGDIVPCYAERFKQEYREVADG